MAKTDSWVLYGYNPSLVLPVVCACLFGVATLIHIALTTRGHCWRLMWAFNLGCFGEVVGYLLRKYSAQHPTGADHGLGLFIGQNLCIILAPACLAASEYMVFGRMVMWIGRHHSLIRPTRVTRIFVFFDVLSFIVQGVGGSLFSAGKPSLYTPAKAIICTGFLIQIISFGVFGIFAKVTERRAARAGDLPVKAKHLLWTLYLGIIFILIRSVFRTIEFAEGTNETGYFLRREVWYYCLETFPIFLCVCLFIISHPSRYIPRNRFERLHPEVPMVASTLPENEHENVDPESIEKSASSQDSATLEKKWWSKRRATSSGGP